MYFEKDKIKESTIDMNLAKVLGVPNSVYSKIETILKQTIEKDV